MNIHDMTEESYKNGYNAGLRDFKRALKEKIANKSPLVVSGMLIARDIITEIEEKLRK